MIIEISPNNQANIALLERFISSMGNSSKSFRYFATRPISVINNHLCTVLLLVDDKPIGYGHLDKEGNNVWFGIAIIEDFVGKKMGSIIIKYLLDKADQLKLPVLRLSVDESNIPAIKLYEKYGFEKKDERDAVLFFSRIK